MSLFLLIHIIYNIFKILNMNQPGSSGIDRMSDLLQAVSPPARLEILLAIGEGEACVCHLEMLLQMRQAYISQHLMALREAGVILARREGRYVYYRLADQRLLELMQLAGQICGMAGIEARSQSAAACQCPNCAGPLSPPLVQIETPGLAN